MRKPESQTPKAARSSRAGAMSASECGTHQTPTGIQESCTPLEDQQAPQGRAECPQIYRSPEVKTASRQLAAYSEAQHAKGCHHVLFNDCEFLHVYYAVEHDRSAMRKAIGKGLADIQDLRATQTLWDKLQAIMAARMYRRRPI